MRKWLPVLVLLPALVSLIWLSALLPPFGSAEAPVHNEVYRRYIEQGVEETGAVNVVTEIVVDYRAYDTLIETTVLFTALAAISLALAAGGKNHA